MRIIPWKSRASISTPRVARNSDSTSNPGVSSPSWRSSLQTSCSGRWAGSLSAASRSGGSCAALRPPPLLPGQMTSVAARLARPGCAPAPRRAAAGAQAASPPLACASVSSAGSADQYAAGIIRLSDAPIRLLERWRRSIFGQWAVQVQAVEALQHPPGLLAGQQASARTREAVMRVAASSVASERQPGSCRASSISAGGLLIGDLQIGHAPAQAAPAGLPSPAQSRQASAGTGKVWI